MRILYWSGLFWPRIGGIEVLATRFLPALRQRGHEVTVVTSRDPLDLPERDSYDGIEIYRFPFTPALVNRNLRKIAELTRAVADLKNQLDIHLVHLNSTGLDAFYHLHSQSARPAPTLATVHSFLKPYAEGRDTFLGRVLESAQWTTAVSAAVLTQLQTLFPTIAPRSSLVHNGLDLPAEPPAPLPFDPPHLVCLGRLVAEKGFDVALEALAQLQTRHPGIRMTIAGDGPEYDSLRNLAAAHKLDERVTFTGWVDPHRIPALLNTATMVLIPSRWVEPFGLVAVQAGQMARPVVTSATGGLAEIIINGKTGLLVEPDNTHALAGAVDQLLSNPDRARVMGTANRARTRERFSLERYVDETEALYHALACAQAGAEKGTIRRTSDRNPAA